MVKAGRFAGQPHLLADLHIRRVVAQAGKLVGAQTIPILGLPGNRRTKQRVGATTVQKHNLVKELRVFQRVRAAVAGDDADLVLPVQHAAFNRGQRGHVQIQRHVRRLLGEQRNRLGDMGLRVAGRLVEHGHVQLPTHAFMDLIDATAKGVGCG